MIATWSIPERGVTVSLDCGAYTHMLAYRQLGWFDREAGGPLFTTDLRSPLVITAAAGPFPKDKRRRTMMVPDRSSAQREVDRRRSIDQHFVGTWHTHPSAAPYPSGHDITSMANLFRGSIHQLTAFVMMIVGTDGNPATWHVSLHNGMEWVSLHHRARSPKG